MSARARSVRFGLGIAFALLVGVACGATDRLLGPNDPLVSDLARLYRLDARPFPTVAYPVSREWLDEAARRLERTVRPDLADEVLRYIERLEYAPGLVRTGVDLVFRPELYLETDPLRGDAALPDALAEKLARESPALTLRVSGATDGGPLLFTRVEAIRQYSVEAPSNITPPFEGNPIPYEFNNVYEGYLLVPFRFVDVTFGRQEIALGPSPRASIALASQVPYLDALRVTLDLGPIRMHHTVSSIDGKRAVTDVDLDAADPSVYDFDRNQIFFNTHYFEYRFLRWRLGVGANLVVSREMNNFHISDFFPVFSWHNANILPRNMSAFVDASVAVAPGVEVYGQASYDDIRTTSLGISDQPHPTISAFTLGGRWSVVAEPVTVDVGADLGYTHYLWGSFPRADGLSRAIFRIRRGGASYALPLTAPYGPGTLYGIVSATASASRFSATLRYEAIGRKPDVSLFTTAHVESADLAAQPYAVRHRAEVEGTFTPNERFELVVRPGGLAGDARVAAYVDVGLRISYSGSRVVSDLR